MRRILSIICIILIIGITSAVPYYSTSYFVFADEQNEQLSDDEILNAAISVYLNARNGFITIADGTVSGAKILMNNYIDSFILFYNANHSIQNQISKSSLIGNILVNYNPFRVSLKGSAVNFFNSLYNYLEDQGKVDNASESNGGITTDNLYNGYAIGNLLFYIYNSTDTIESGSSIIPADKMIGIGSCVDFFTGESCYQRYAAANPNNNRVIGQNNGNSQQSVSVNITFSSNIIYNGTALGYGSIGGGYYTNVNPCLSVVATNSCLYSTLNHQVRGCAAWFIDRNVPNYSYYGIASYDITQNVYFFTAFGRVSRNDSGATSTNINFETDNFDKQPLSVPEEGKEVQFTPKDKTSGNTYNTYNEYINNYVTKNTVINKKIINEGDNGEDDPTTPTDPTNPTDPSQPTTQNPYPLDPTDPSAPTGGTIPDWTTPSGNGGSGTITPDGNGGYTFELPDFSLPDLDINWSISGLAEKFPFSIPFDLYALFTVLNAEPETPEIHGEIPIWTYTWEIDWDLHQFDSIAALMRNLEFIAFCIGLALITRNIIRG